MDAVAAGLVHLCKRACRTAGVDEAAAVAAARLTVAQHYRRRADDESISGQWADTADARRQREQEARRLRATAEQLEKEAI